MRKFISAILTAAIAITTATPVIAAELEPENIIIAEEETDTETELTATTADSDHTWIDDEKGALHISFDRNADDVNERKIVTEITHHGKPLIIYDGTNRSVAQISFAYGIEYSYWSISDAITGNINHMVGQDKIHEVLEAARNYERENGKTEEEIKKIEIIYGALNIGGCGGEGNYAGHAMYGWDNDMIYCNGYNFDGEYRNDPDEPLPEVIDPIAIQRELNEIYVKGKTTAKKIKMAIYCGMPNTGVEYTIRVKAPNSKSWKEYKATKTSADKETNVSIKTKLTGKFKIQVQGTYVYDGVTYTGEWAKYKVTKTK